MDTISILAYVLTERVKDISNISSNDKQNLEELIWEFRDVFSKKPGRIKNFEYDLILIDENDHFYKSYPIPKKFENTVDKEIQRMLNLGIIERSKSNYINPIVCVIKKDMVVFDFV